MADASSVVVCRLANCVWQAAGWVDVAKKNISERVASFLAGQVGPDNSLDVGMINPWHIDWTDRVDDHDGVFISIGDSSDLCREKK